MLHVAERVAQLAYLVRTLEVRQLGIEASRGYVLCFLGQTPQWLQLLCDDTNEEIEHQQETDSDDAHHRPA